MDRVPASYRSPSPGAPAVHAASVDHQPYSDDRLRYQSLSGNDDSCCCSSSSASDDEDLMTSSSPSHVIGVTSPSPPRQLSVCDLFTYQRPRQTHPGLSNVSTALTAQHRSTVNVPADTVKTDHVTLRYWTEPETEDAEQRRARRLPVSSLSFDDSAIDNQSAPSTSSGGSRVHYGGSRINQSGLSTRTNGSCCDNGCNGDTSGHYLTRTVAVIQCSPVDVTAKLTSLQTVAGLRQDESEEKRSRGRAPLTSETNEVTI